MNWHEKNELKGCGHLTLTLAQEFRLNSSSLTNSNVDVLSFSISLFLSSSHSFILLPPLALSSCVCLSLALHASWTGACLCVYCVYDANLTPNKMPNQFYFNRFLLLLFGAFFLSMHTYIRSTYQCVQLYTSLSLFRSLFLVLSAFYEFVWFWHHRLLLLLLLCWLVFLRSASLFLNNVS